MYDPYVTIPNPDDPHGQPIFDGPSWDAHKVLIPGVYRGTWDASDLESESDRPGTLIVYGPKSDNPYPTHENWANKPGAVWYDDVADVCIESGAPVMHLPWSWGQVPRDHRCVHPF